MTNEQNIDKDKSDPIIIIERDKLVNISQVLQRALSPGEVLNKNVLLSRTELREWWHHILRTNGYYECYGIFLTLPADKEALRYLTDFSRELDIITGADCLIIALGKSEFKVSNFDAKNWSLSINEQTEEGYSVKIAEFFGLDLLKFPCLLIFRDIRSPRHVVISLAKMTAEQIADEMRSIFSIIHKAVADKISPLDAIVEHQHMEKLRQTRQTIAGKVTGFAGKTFETAMEAWIGTVIK
jgi:hypothetical protein